MFPASNRCWELANFSIFFGVKEMVGRVDSIIKEDLLISCLDKDGPSFTTSSSHELFFPEAEWALWDLGFIMFSLGSRPG